jgi:hypothetical protein
MRATCSTFIDWCRCSFGFSPARPSEFELHAACTRPCSASLGAPLMSSLADMPCPACTTGCHAIMLPCSASVPADTWHTAGRVDPHASRPQTQRGLAWSSAYLKAREAASAAGCAVLTPCQSRSLRCLPSTPPWKQFPPGSFPLVCVVWLPGPRLPPQTQSWPWIRTAAGRSSQSG